MKNKISHRSLTVSAMVGAAYAVIYLLFPPIGLMQFRISESLSVLSVYSPSMAVGAVLGCFISNVIGVSTGANPFALDILFGTLATAIAGWLSYKLRRFKFKSYPYLSVLPPVLVNAVIIGAELSIQTNQAILLNPFLTFGGMVALSQIIPCMIIGPVLIWALDKTDLPNRFLLEVN